MPKYEAICHTKCFFRNVLWNPGDRYVSDTEPANKHFSKDGIPPGETKEAHSAGDDPRSTAEMIVTLRTRFGVSDIEGKPIDEKTPRKMIWLVLRGHERASAPGASTEPPKEKVEPGKFEKKEGAKKKAK